MWVDGSVKVFGECHLPFISPSVYLLLSSSSPIILILLLLASHPVLPSTYRLQCACEGGRHDEFYVILRHRQVLITTPEQLLRLAHARLTEAAVPQCLNKHKRVLQRHQSVYEKRCTQYSNIVT